MSPEIPPQPGFLGAFLDAQLQPERIRVWKIIFFVSLLVVALLSLVIPNLHPHFGYDKYPFFWVAFGLGFGVILVVAVKKIIQPIIKKPEDFYGDL
ncbi:MAG: hypothetical protein LBF22_13580 [Deltaproteobacteria bacterium]|jgi:hypothetical protein|nr:hypothetical protein [Deltaproteobacteria bacterium]